MADFMIVNHGSIWIVTPLSEAAIKHCDEFMPDDAQMFAKGYVVEPRYVADILIDLEDHGFELGGTP